MCDLCAMSGPLSVGTEIVWCWNTAFRRPLTHVGVPMRPAPIAAIRRFADGRLPEIVWKML